MDHRQPDGVPRSCRMTSLIALVLVLGAIWLAETL